MGTSGSNHTSDHMPIYRNNNGIAERVDPTVNDAGTAKYADVYLNRNGNLVGIHTPREIGRFEQGDVSRWTAYDARFTAVTDRPRSGTYAGYINTTSGTDTSDTSTISERALDPHTQPSRITLYFQETAGSTGQGFRLRNSNGSYEAGVASNNPQWEIDDANGSATANDPGNGYNHWVEIIIDFDWANSEFTVTFTSEEDGVTFTSSPRPLKVGTDIKLIEFASYNNGWGQSSVVSWIDDLGSNGIGASNWIKPTATFEDVERADPIADYQGTTGDFTVNTSSPLVGSQSFESVDPYGWMGTDTLGVVTDGYEYRTHAQITGSRFVRVAFKTQTEGGSFDATYFIEVDAADDVEFKKLQDGNFYTLNSVTQTVNENTEYIVGGRFYGNGNKQAVLYDAAGTEITSTAPTQDTVGSGELPDGGIGYHAGNAAGSLYDEVHRVPLKG